MLKILAIGDPHFRTKYIKTIDQFIQQTIDLVKALTTDMVVVLGDTLHHHERTDSECHVRAIKWFKSLSTITKLVVLIGNHDRRNNSDFQTEYHFFTGLTEHKNIWIVDKATSLSLVIGQMKHRLVFVPYVPPQRFQEALDTLETNITDNVPTVIFAHQEFKGAKMGAIISEIGDEWDLNNPLVISGHLHECQTPQENIFYCGTPYQTTYSEDANKGVYLFTFKNSKTPEIKRVKLNLRVKSSVTIAPNELNDFVLPNSNMDLRIIVVGKHEEVEALKSSKKYNELRKQPNISIVLRPQLEFKSIPKIYQKSYKQVLFEDIKDNPILKQIYVEVLGDIQ